MSNTFALRLGTLVVMLAAFFGMTSQAYAAPAKPDAGSHAAVRTADSPAGTVAVRTTDGQIEVTSLSSDDVTILGTHKFNKADTQRIYIAALTLGAAGVTALCGAIAPIPAKPFCPLLGAAVVAHMLNNPPNGRCLQISWNIWPPKLSLKYVKC